MFLDIRFKLNRISRVFKLTNWQSSSVKSAKPIPWDLLNIVELYPKSIKFDPNPATTIDFYQNLRHKYQKSLSTKNHPQIHWHLLKSILLRPLSAETPRVLSRPTWWPWESLPWRYRESTKKPGGERRFHQEKSSTKSQDGAPMGPPDMFVGL